MDSSTAPFPVLFLHPFFLFSVLLLDHIDWEGESWGEGGITWNELNQNWLDPKEGGEKPEL